MELRISIPPRLRSSLRPFLDPRLPDVAIEIGEGFSSGAAVAAGGQRMLRSFFLVEHPASGARAALGSMPPLPAAWSEHLAALATRAGIPPQPVSLVIPDAAARVMLLTLDSVPRRRRDVEAMIRWRTKKSLPFRVEDAIVDFIHYPPEEGDRQHTLLVGILRRKTIEQYESACAAVGFTVGMVNLSTFALQGLFASRIAAETARGTDVGLLNLTDRAFSFLILRGDRPIFFRAKALEHLASSGPDAVRRTAQSELLPTLQYYRDRLQGKGLARLYLRDLHARADGSPDLLESMVSCPMTPLDPRGIVRVPAETDPGPEVLARLAPAIGLALQARA